MPLSTGIIIPVISQVSHEREREQRGPTSVSGGTGGVPKLYPGLWDDRFWSSGAEPNVFCSYPAAGLKWACQTIVIDGVVCSVTLNRRAVPRTGWAGPGTCFLRQCPPAPDSQERAKKGQARRPTSPRCRRGAARSVEEANHQPHYAL